METLKIPIIIRKDCAVISELTDLDKLHALMGKYHNRENVINGISNMLKFAFSEYKIRDKDYLGHVTELSLMKDNECYARLLLGLESTLKLIPSDY
jgi:hypothetical protein